MTTADNVKSDLTKNGWYDHLLEVFDTRKSKHLKEFLTRSYAERRICPERGNIFRVLREMHINDVKVVIVGQDPYHGPGQANGYAFAVNKGRQAPPSLRNMAIEVGRDLGIPTPENAATLEKWASQGVLLLNSILTVDEGSPASHRGKGWEEITDCIIRTINDNRNGVVFILWGNYAKNKGKLIDRMKHAVLEAGHPSPYSCNMFFGCRHFTKANEILVRLARGAIDWSDMS